MNRKGGLFMLDHIENYLNWLKSNMTQTRLDNNMIEITTPFLDRHNDYTQIYLKEVNSDTFLVTDCGYTINDLKLSGVDLDTDHRKLILQQILNRTGLRYNPKTDEIYIEVGRNKLPSAQHTLIQGMLDINDMFFLNTPVVTNLFGEDVKKFFDDNDIFYSQDISITGRSGLTHYYPFHLQKNKQHPERFIKIANRLIRADAERFMFAWGDVADARNANAIQSNLIIIINDAVKVSRSLTESLHRYDESIIPVLWSRHEEEKELFA